MSETNSKDLEQLYAQRLNRYVTAMRNEKPDMVPIRPFVAEVTAVHAGYTCQQVVHDYEYALAAARRCAADFDWDAVVGNMVYVWTGLTQAIGLEYYGIPGIDVPPDVGFQYREPAEERAYMQPDEYDQLIEDPTGLPLQRLAAARLDGHPAARAQPVTYRHNLALVKGAMAMMQYFGALGSRTSCCGRNAARYRRSPGSSRRRSTSSPTNSAAISGWSWTCTTQPRQSARGLRGPGAAPGPSGPGHGRSDRAGPGRLLDAPRLRAVRQPPAVPLALLADHQADRRGVVGARAPDAVLRRGQVERAPGQLRELPDQSIVYHVDQDDIFAAHRKSATSSA